MYKKMMSKANADNANVQVNMTKNIYIMMKQISNLVINEAKKNKKQLAPEVKGVLQNIVDYQVDLDHLQPQDIANIHQMYNNAMMVLNRV